MKALILISILLLSSLGFSAKEAPILQIDEASLQKTSAWANNTKINIERSFNFAERTTISKRTAIYLQALQDAVNDSNRDNESLMRFVLFRAHEVYKVLKDDTAGPKKENLIREFLYKSLKYAVNLYEEDKSVFQNKKENKPIHIEVAFALMGLKWIDFSLNYYYRTSSNETRLQLVKKLLLIWQTDTSRDFNYNRLLAPVTHNLAQYYNQLDFEIPQSSIDKLFLSREILTFLKDEIILAKRLIRKTTKDKNIKLSNTFLSVEMDQPKVKQYIKFSGTKCKPDYISTIRFKEDSFEQDICVHKSALGSTFFLFVNNVVPENYFCSEPVKYKREFSRHDYNHKRCYDLNNLPDELSVHHDDNCPNSNYTKTKRLKNEYNKTVDLCQFIR